MLRVSESRSDEIENQLDRLKRRWHELCSQVSETRRAIDSSIRYFSLLEEVSIRASRLPWSTRSLPLLRGAERVPRPVMAVAARATIFARVTYADGNDNDNIDASRPTSAAITIGPAIS